MVSIVSDIGFNMADDMQPPLEDFADDDLFASAIEVI